MSSPSADSTRRLIDTLARSPVVAILRAGHAGHLVTAAEVLADAGMRAVESPKPRPVPSASSATAGRNLQPR